jgi:two-component system cell cycle response regulator
MILDIDYFKEVNDKYGHLAGDESLKVLATILKSSFRVTDLIARYGGEEFVILLGGTDINYSKKIAERVRSAIESLEINIPGKQEPLKKTVSIGIAEFNNKESVTCFVDRADKALYEAKAKGRNKVIAR